MKDLLIALVFNIIYFVLFWGVHLLFGTKLETFNFIIGNAVLWGVLAVTTTLLSQLRKIFRLESSDAVPFITNIVIVVIVMLFSSFFIAWHTQIAFEILALWKQLILHIFSLLYVYITFMIVTSYYTGDMFKITGLAVSIIAYLIFAIFPKLTTYLASLIF